MCTTNFKIASFEVSKIKGWSNSLIENDTGGSPTVTLEIAIWNVYGMLISIFFSLAFGHKIASGVEN